MATKDAIKQALSQLDPANDEHWTDDGLPVVSAVQRLANDPEIRRADIQSVAPTFSRPTGDAMGEPTEKLTGTEDKVEGNGGIMLEGEPTDEHRAAALAQLSDAETNLAAARNTTADAIKAERTAQKALDAAKISFNMAFPPMSAAANIKAHLRNEVANRAARVIQHGTITVGKDNIDVAMNGRASKGGQRSVYQRPQYGAR